MPRLVITRGRVVDPKQAIDGEKTIVVEGGKIAALLGPKDPIPDGEIVDASGGIVTPGFIDAHVHLREPGHEYKEDIETGTRAAAAGGFTTVCCMPNTDPVNDSAATTSYIQGRAKEAGVVSVIPVGAISKGLRGEQLSDIGDMAALGVAGFTDDGRPVMSSSLMRRAMEYATSFGKPIITHAEDLSLGKGVMNEGIVSTSLGLKGIPDASEEIMIGRDIILARMTGAHLHVAHLSTKGGVAMIRHAKEQGIHVTAEVTPHHLILTDEACRTYDPNTKMHPPLRTEEDREALIEGLADGTIDIVATDHAPHAIIDKEVGFDEAAFGIVGLETALPLCLKLVEEKRISLGRLIEALTIRPAEIFAFGERGSFTKGARADITIFHTKTSVIVDPERFYSKSKNTPFGGWELKGFVSSTIVAGRAVYTAQ